MDTDGDGTMDAAELAAYEEYKAQKRLEAAAHAKAIEDGKLQAKAQMETQYDTVCASPPLPSLPTPPGETRGTTAGRSTELPPARPLSSRGVRSPASRSGAGGTATRSTRTTTAST